MNAGAWVLIVMGIVFVAVIVSIVVGIFWNDKSYDKCMAAWGWNDERSARPDPKDWYEASETCEGCLSRIGDECRIGPPVAIMMKDGIPILEAGGAIWPKVKMDGKCRLWQPDVCPNCRGTKHEVDVRYNPGLEIHVRTKWWKWCVACKRTGRVLEHVT